MLDQSKKYDDIDDIQSEIDSLEQTLREFPRDWSVNRRKKQESNTSIYISSLDENIKKTTHEIKNLETRKLDNTEKDELKLLQQNLRVFADYAKLTEQKQLYDYPHELCVTQEPSMLQKYVPIINKYVNKYLNDTLLTFN